MSSIGPVVATIPATCVIPTGRNRALALVALLLGSMLPLTGCVQVVSEKTLEPLELVVGQAPVVRYLTNPVGWKDQQLRFKEQVVKATVNSVGELSLQALSPGFTRVTVIYSRDGAQVSTELAVFYVDVTVKAAPGADDSQSATVDLIVEVRRDGLGYEGAEVAVYESPCSENAEVCVGDTDVEGWFICPGLDAGVEYCVEASCCQPPLIASAMPLITDEGDGTMILVLELNPAS